MKKVGILISGRGSNMESLLLSMRERDFPCDAKVVISNIETASGLEKAKKLNVKTEVINHKDSKTREEHDEKMVEVLKREGVEIVCLAGYMRLLSPLFVREFKNKILNIHPALLPAFPGLDVQKKAVESGVRFSGCTVHIVDELCDHGPILLQSVVPVFPDDDSDKLAKRILKFEHKTYPLALKLFAEEKFEIEGNRALLKVDNSEYEEIVKKLMWNGE